MPTIKPEQDGEQHRPDTEPDGGEKALEQDVGHPALLLRVEPDQVGRDDRPVPFVVEGEKQPVGQKKPKKPRIAARMTPSRRVIAGFFGGMVVAVIGELFYLTCPVLAVEPVLMALFQPAFEGDEVIQLLKKARLSGSPLRMAKPMGSLVKVPADRKEQGVAVVDRLVGRPRGGAD